MRTSVTNRDRASHQATVNAARMNQEPGALVGIGFRGHCRCRHEDSGRGGGGRGVDGCQIRVWRQLHTCIR
jgi:hypothetical protein